MRPTLSQLRTLTARTTYQWSVRFDNMPSGVKADIKPEEIDLRAISSDVPKKTVNKIEWTMKGFTVNQPGTYTVNSPITLTFLSTIDMKLEEFFRNWREACTRTDEGTHLPLDQVTCDISLILLDRNDKPVWRYKLVGAWLSEYDSGSLDSDNNTANTVATIEFVDVYDGRP